jgi:hypothetical protein
MKIRMELTEALVTEDITPFERQRLRQALEEELRRQLPADRRLVRVVDWDPGGGHAVENTPGMRSTRSRTRRNPAIRAARTDRAGRSPRRAFIHNLCIDRRRGEVGVPQQCLRGAKIGASGDEIRAVPMPQTVRGPEVSPSGSTP